MAHSTQTVFRKIISLPLVFYKKVISPFLPRACLYHPSCSEYAIGAIGKHGLIRGAALGLARLLRCNGFLFSGGEDPVPEKFGWKNIREGYRIFRKKKRKE